MSDRIILPFERNAEVMADHYKKGFVCFRGSPPCVIIDTFGDEAVIKAITTGQEYCVQKKDLLHAEVHFAEPPTPRIESPEPDWNRVIDDLGGTGRTRHYTK